MASARFFGWGAILCSAILLAAPCVPIAEAIEIVFNLDDEDENAPWDSDGQILLSMFEAAADYWEPIFPYNSTYYVEVEWDNDISGLGLWQPGVPHDVIEINPNYDWWVDPTPSESSEFDFSDNVRQWSEEVGWIFFEGQWLYRDIGEPQRSDWFHGPVPELMEIGYRGSAIGGGAVDKYDLLSTCIHELGHELGINFEIDDEFSIYPEHVGGAEDVGIEADSLSGHIAPRSALMCDSCGYDNMRRLPSAVDILAIANDESYTVLHMPRTEFLNNNNNFSNPLNWIGGMPAYTTAATVQYGGAAVNATANANMEFADLTLLNDSRVSTGSYLLDVGFDLTIDGENSATAPRLTVEPGGTVTAQETHLLNGGQLIMYGGLLSTGRLEVVGGFSGQFAMLPGATLRVDRLIGFNDNLQFWGNLQIGQEEIEPGQLTILGHQTLTVVGTMTVGPSPGGSGTVSVYSGGQVDTGPLQVGGTSSSGVVLVSGFNIGTGLLSDWDVSGDLTVGSTGIGSGNVTIQDSGMVDVTGSATVRGSPDATSLISLQTLGRLAVGGTLDIAPFGQLQLIGTGTRLTADEIALSVGGTFSDGAGTLVRVNRLTGFANMTNFNGSLEIGHPGGVAGHTVGVGQSLDVAEKLTVGKDAAGQLYVNGTVESGRSYLAAEPSAAGSTVSVSGPGARWDVLENLYVGGTEALVGGAATLNIGNYGQIEVDQSLTVAPGSYVTVGTSSTDGTLTVRNTLRVYTGASLTVGTAGNVNANTLDLAGGGILLTSGNSTVRTNFLAGFGSSLTINGNFGVGWPGGANLGNVAFTSGQNLAVTGVLYLGSGVPGTMTLANGGTAQIGQARIGDGGGTGTLIVTRPNSTLTQNGDVYVGYFSGGSVGNLQIDVGGIVLGNNHNAFVGSGIGTMGTALVNNANSRWTGLNALYVGGNAAGAGGTGTLAIADTAEVGAASTTVWATGAIHLDNGVLRPGSLNLAGGRLEGVGSVILNGSLTNGGIIAPGNTTGLLTLTNGNFMQTASGMLFIDLGGIHSGEFDRFEVHRGNGSLAGGLQVSLVDGFLPSVGNVFEVLWVEEVLSGAFDPALISVPTLPGRQWNVVQRRGAVRLEVLAAEVVPGDYNANGVVDAADYVVWRKTNINGQQGYIDWRAHFGQTSGAATSQQSIDLPPIPEPASFYQLCTAGAAVALQLRRRRAR